MNRFFGMILSLAALVACSQLEPVTDEVPAGSRSYTMTVKATKATPSTRGLSLDDKTLNVKWNEGEKVDVIQDFDGGESHYVGTLTASASDNGSTTLTGTITPYSTDSKAFRFCLHGYKQDYTGQKGQLLKPSEGEDNSIESKYDYAIAEDIPEDIVHINDKAVTFDENYEGISFVSQQAIVKFTLFGDDGKPLNATRLTISGDGHKIVQVYDAMTELPDSRGDLELTGLSGQTNEIFVSINQGKMGSISWSANLTFTAFDENGLKYTYGPKQVSFETGKYYEIKMTMKNEMVNLSTLPQNSEYTATDGFTLTGKPNAVKIIIADGATVRLKDTEIYGGYSLDNEGDLSGHFAGITCAGNATLVIEGNNYVEGCDNLPGIIVREDGAYNAKTLTLKGDGFLKASADTSPADPFKHGSSATGIGGDEEGCCGNIVIEGTLTVEAYGGESCPGIGGHDSCGYITIGKDVKLKAVKGADFDGFVGYCIGSYINEDDESGSGCGAITIGGTVYFDGKNFLSPEFKKALTADTFTYPGNQ
ncbi:MAG: hypothetical protein J6O51_03110 [Bacteroidales bacterium]|nr:hypothetical protein [Bacteroidales bacterium]